MVRVLESKFVKHGVKWYVFSGSATDTKPTEGVCDGSVFIESDEEKVYMYNEDEADWIKWG